VRIGLTYDLRAEYLALGYGEEETAEFDQQGTIDALADAIESLGHSVDRIGSARSLVNRLAKGDRWELVFNIAEGLYGYGREAQVPAILDVYGITYTFADPLAASVCLHKAGRR
jgi:D-alanine-D-alanine ligase